MAHQFNKRCIDHKRRNQTSSFQISLSVSSFLKCELVPFDDSSLILVVISQEEVVEEIITIAITICTAVAITMRMTITAAEATRMCSKRIAY